MSQHEQILQERRRHNCNTRTFPLTSSLLPSHPQHSHNLNPFKSDYLEFRTPRCPKEFMFKEERRVITSVLINHGLLEVWRAFIGMEPCGFLEGFIMNIILYIFTHLFYGIDSISRSIPGYPPHPDWMWGILHGILSVPQNKHVYSNNVMKVCIGVTLNLLSSSLF